MGEMRNSISNMSSNAMAKGQSFLDRMLPPDKQEEWKSSLQDFLARYPKLSVCLDLSIASLLRLVQSFCPPFSNVQCSKHVQASTLSEKAHAHSLYSTPINVSEQFAHILCDLVFLFTDSTI